MWGEGEQSATRKPPEQAQQLIGVFGEGASVLVVPEAARAANAQQARAVQAQAQDQRQALTPEQLQRRAQSRGLWTDGGEVPPMPTGPTASTSQPRAGTLPRAVVGTPSPTVPANSNYKNPSIGNSDSPPSAADPLAAAAAQSTAPQPQAAPEPAQPSARVLPADTGLDGDTIEMTSEQLLRVPQPQPKASKPAAAPVPKPAAPSSPNTTLLLALILIAAIVAVLFIGAAVGLWSLPWGKGSTGRSTLSKAIPAKSLPEMRAVAPVAAVPAPVPVPTAAAVAPEPAAEPQPSAAAPVAAAATADNAPPNSAVVMEAEEAAPLRAPTLSGPSLDEVLDLPSGEIGQAISAARTALRAGHPKEAEAMLRPVLEKNPDDVHVAEALAQALLARGAAVEAVGLAQRIVKKKPKRASYRVLLGDALRRAGDEPSAKLAYKEALALDPKSRDAARRLKNRKAPTAPPVP